MYFLFSNEDVVCKGAGAVGLDGCEGEDDKDGGDGTGGIWCREEGDESPTFISVNLE